LYEGPVNSLTQVPFNTALAFTRASAATARTAIGKVQGVLTDEQRLVGNREGLLIEEARTNLLLNSDALSTQSVTVAAVEHTLHFTGTGTVTLSGTFAGSLVGTGSGEANRVSLNFTPTAGSLTATVSGSVVDAQLEEGSFPTSYIATAGTQVTRAADHCGTTLGNEYNANEGTIYCELTYPIGSGTHGSYGRGGGLICRILAPSGSGFTNQFVVYRYRDTLDISFRDASRSGFDANTLSSGLSIAEGVSTKIAVSWKASVGFTFAAAGVTGVATYTDLPPFASDSISLTTAYDGSKFGGIKKDFRILPIALSETELSALTGGA